MATASQVPVLVVAAASQVPVLVVAAASQVPVLVVAAASQVPVLVVAAASQVPVLVVAAASQVPVLVVAAASQVPVLVVAAASQVPVLVVAPSKEKGTGSKCLIATAAFGSELTPQVQFLRHFRDQNILSTASGSSFMNVFNAWYYSFSPYIANYERQQPWLQESVKFLIYPLLGILSVSEAAYSMFPGEYGALVAGVIASQ